MKRSILGKLGIKEKKWALSLILAGFAALNTGFTSQVNEINAEEVTEEIVESAEVGIVDILPEETAVKGDVLTNKDVVENIDTIRAVENVAAVDISTLEAVAEEPAQEDIVAPKSAEPEYAAIMSMEATAYLPYGDGCTGITAMGIPATYGVVAVDPAIIPLGSRVYIPGYGEAIAADTGGAIYGYRIDLCMESYSEAINFGRRNVTVYVLR